MTAYLVYDPTLALPDTFDINQETWDDSQFVPLDGMELLGGTPDV